MDQNVPATRLSAVIKWGATFMEDVNTYNNQATQVGGTGISELQTENVTLRKDLAELSGIIEACHRILDILEDQSKGETSLEPLDERLRRHLFPGDVITDDMVNGDD